MSEGQQKKTLGIAIASLVFGCLFIVPFLGIMFSLTAVILGIIALVKIGNNKETLKGRGMAIWGIVLGGLGILIIPYAILAAIAIPNLLRARLHANEAAAQARIRTVGTAIEAYAAANEGKYPLSESELIDAQPPYLDQAYNNNTVQGYHYSIKLNPDTYEITAEPAECISTGIQIFINRNGEITESKCEKYSSTEMRVKSREEIDR